MITDPEARRAYDRAKYLRHRDAIKARVKRYYAANREQVRDRQAAYYQSHRETILAQQATRKARLRPPPTPRPHPTHQPRLLIGVVQSSPLPGREPGPPPAPTPAERKPVWTPTPVNTEITPPRRPTVYLCSCGLGFPTKERANRHERNHPHATATVSRPLGEHREVSVLGL